MKQGKDNKLVVSDRIITACGAINVEGKVYFYGTNVNGLFSMDNSTKKISYIDRDEAVAEGDVYRYNGNPVAYENYLIFAPFRSKRILIYDLGESKSKYVDLAEAGCFSYSILYGQWVYFMRSDAVYRLHVNDWHVEKHDYFSAVQNGSKYAFYNNSIYAVAPNECLLYEYDLKEDKIIKHNVDNSDGGLCAICTARGKLWIADNSCGIICMDVKSGVTKRLDLPEEVRIRDTIQGESVFCLCESVGEYVYFSPWRLDSVICADTRTNELSIIDKLAENEAGFNFFSISDNEIGLNITDYHTEYEVDYNLVLNSEGKAKKENIFLADNAVGMIPGMKETRVNTLDDFLEHILGDTVKLNSKKVK